MRVNVGDVVLVKHRTLEDEEQSGLFVVIYHECEDMRTSDTFTAIKISSREGSYQIPLTTDRVQFLDHDSYINCNSIMRFREPSVYRILGTLNPYYLNKIITQTNCYFKRMHQQLIEHIPDGCLFSNLDTAMGVINKKEGD